MMKLLPTLSKSQRDTERRSRAIPDRFTGKLRSAGNYSVQSDPTAVVNFSGLTVIPGSGTKSGPTPETATAYCHDPFRYQA